jgi:hypothetical protein
MNHPIFQGNTPYVAPLDAEHDSLLKSVYGQADSVADTKGFEQWALNRVNDDDEGDDEGDDAETQAAPESTLKPLADEENA